jgi:hypothetical protein
MNQRRASGSLGVEVPDMMKKSKWMFNPNNQASHEESHISKCQSLLNQDIKWHGDQKWKLISHEKYSKSQPPRVNVKARSSVATPMKSKRNEVAIIHFVQAQVEEMYFVFNIEYRLPLYQEGYHMDCQQSLNAQKILKPKWDEWNSMTSYTSLLPEHGKTRQFDFTCNG